MAFFETLFPERARQEKYEYDALDRKKQAEELALAQAKIKEQKLNEILHVGPGRAQTEEAMRRIFGGGDVAQGPLTQPQTQGVEAGANFQEVTGLPNNYGNMTPTQFKTIGEGVKDFGATGKEDLKDQRWQDRFDKTQERADQRQQNMFKQQDEREERKKAALAEKPLSGEASKVFAISKTIVPEINQLKTAFLKDYKGSLYGIVSGTNRPLVKLVDQIADKVGRIRSGGAINRDEEIRFKRQIASFMDIPFGKSEGAMNALDGILAEADQVSAGIRPHGGQSQVTQYGSPGAVKAAVAQQKLSPEEAKQILQTQFGFE